MKIANLNLSHRHIMMSYIIIVVVMLAMDPMSNCHVNAFSIRHNNIAVQSIYVGKCRSSDLITHRSSLCNLSIKYGMQNDNDTPSSTSTANFEETTTTTDNDNLEIIRGDKSNEISDDIWVDIEDGAPSKFEIMKNVSTSL
jgi:hypothetical protein